MRAKLLSFALGIGLVLVAGASAQTSGGVTATCKDGSSFTGTSRSGACRGHKGVATWGTTDAAASTSAAPAASTQQAPGAATPQPRSYAANSAGSVVPKTGLPGQVWVNTSSKVYHCPGTRYYGKTKQGEYMSEAAAKAAGDRASGGKACS
jgi:hypothetical protein